MTCPLARFHISLQTETSVSLIKNKKCTFGKWECTLRLYLVFTLTCRTEGRVLVLHYFLHLWYKETLPCYPSVLVIFGNQPPSLSSPASRYLHRQRLTELSLCHMCVTDRTHTLFFLKNHFFLHPIFLPPHILYSTRSFILLYKHTHSGTCMHASTH